jgi:hypothetical protein
MGMMRLVSSTGLLLAVLVFVQALDETNLLRKVREEFVTHSSLREEFGTQSSVRAESIVSYSIV